MARNRHNLPRHNNQRRFLPYVRVWAYDKVRDVYYF